MRARSAPSTLRCSHCGVSFVRRYVKPGAVFCTRVCWLKLARKRRRDAFQSATSVRRSHEIPIDFDDVPTVLVVGRLPLKPPGHPDWSCK